MLYQNTKNVESVIQENLLGVSQSQIDNIENFFEKIRQDMEMYLKYARIAYVQMLKDILPVSDYVIDGTKELEEKVKEIIEVITAL